MTYEEVSNLLEKEKYVLLQSISNKEEICIVTLGKRKTYMNLYYFSYGCWHRFKTHWTHLEHKHFELLLREPNSSTLMIKDLFEFKDFSKQLEDNT